MSRLQKPQQNGAVRVRRKINKAETMENVEGRE